MGILTEEMQHLVRRIRLGYVATVCPDGSPNLSPKGTTTVWDDDHLVFADLRSPNTVANLRHNPLVEINVVDPLIRKGYRFKGPAQVLTEGDLYEQIIAFYEQQGAQRQRIRSVVLVTVTQARPLISPAYDLGVSEAEVRDRWVRYYADQEP
jgi:predicted pyridoxine 5'-phosphate oxidase superfamily flavin-nucleotide-binding protein